jgi:hypothetical protein
MVGRPWVWRPVWFVSWYVSLLFAAVAIIKSFVFAYSTRPFLAANYVKIIKDPDEGITGITAIALYDYDVSTFLRLELTLVPCASGSNGVVR